MVQVTFSRHFFVYHLLNGTKSDNLFQVLPSCWNQKGLEGFFGWFPTPPLLFCCCCGFVLFHDSFMALFPCGCMKMASKTLQSEKGKIE